MATQNVFNSKWTEAAKAHVAYCEDKPEWMALALECVNKWGKQELILQHAIALALEDAYERGVRGEPPIEVIMEAPRVIRRSRPEIKRVLIRRTR